VPTNRYRIVIRGGVGKAASDAFRSLMNDRVGADTELVGEMDQSGLYGILHRIESLGLELVAVNRLE
jgi:hypothetical protein